MIIGFCEGFIKGSIIALFATILFMMAAPHVAKYFNEPSQISDKREASK
jgi:hypothetical protein